MSGMIAPLRRGTLGAALAFALCAASASAQVDLALSFDENTAYGAVSPADQEISGRSGGAWSNFLAAMTAAIPANANLDALSLLSPTQVYFSTEEDCVIGGTAFARNDVILWNGATFSMAWSGSFNGLPANSNIDALDVISGSPMEFSFSLDADAALTVGGTPSTAVSRSDVIHFLIGSGFTAKDFSAAAASVPANLNLDAFNRLTATQWIMSFDAAGQIGSLAFGPSDLLQWDSVGMAFNGSLYFNASGAGIPAAANVDAAVANMSVLNTPTPSPSPSPSATASASQSPSQSPTPSPSQSPSPSASASASPSPSPSASQSPTPSPSASASPSPSKSASPSPTASASPSPSSTGATPTPTPSATPSVSPTPNAGEDWTIYE